MNMKIIGILISMLLIATLLPSIGAMPANTVESIGNGDKVFKNCYVEAQGLVDSSPPHYRPLMFKIFYLRSLVNDRSFILYWLIIFKEPKVEVTIYSEENGEVLWQNEDAPLVWGFRLFRFNGHYTHFTDEDGFHVNLRGDAFRAIAATSG
jgi:hypothetical protein